MQYVQINCQNANMEFIINRSREEAALPLTVAEVGHSRPLKGKRADSVTACYQLHYVTSGEGIFRGERICKGMGFLVLPCEVQDMSVESDGFEQYWINFDGREVQGLLFSCGIPVRSHTFSFLEKENGNIQNSLAVTLFNSVFKAKFEGNSEPAQHNHMYLLGLLYQLLSQRYGKTVSLDSTERYVGTVCSCIHARYGEQLTLDWLSDAVGLSPKYLTRVFRRKMGCTVFDYLTRVRLDNAKRLLSSTDKSISEIAAAVGYNDALYFSKVFRKDFGVPPSKWRSDFSRQSSEFTQNTHISNAPSV